MKFTLSFKTPGVLDCAMEDMTDAERKIAAASGVIDKFIEYDEYVYIELDTVTKTAKVLPA